MDSCHVRFFVSGFFHSAECYWESSMWSHHQQFFLLLLSCILLYGCATVSSSVLLDLGFKGTLWNRLQGPGSRLPVLGGTGKRCKCLLPRPQCRRASTSLPRTAGVLGRKAHLPDACGFAFSVPAGLCSAVAPAPTLALLSRLLALWSFFALRVIDLILLVSCPHQSVSFVMAGSRTNALYKYVRSDSM